MLKTYLDDAISVLDELIKTTNLDIQNIKEAKHSAVEESVKLKNDLIKKFENTKSQLDKELLRVSKEQNSTDLASILDDEVKANLVKLRGKLEELHQKNKEYARYVVTVKEFFDSLVSDMFKDKKDESGYSKAQPTPETLFKTRV
ncbi:flagellar export chaperone FlgN [Campylobacter sp.]|uniref:flagellar export chaperone FlgN n=1 Tax=Campylobacter sp. TaxID=205 RepID=UPI00270A35FE|nr:flagellar export chaperone FlgN [Campylobacter sp.]